MSTQIDARLAAKQILKQMPNPPFKFRVCSAVDNLLMIVPKQPLTPNFPIVANDPLCKDIIKLLEDTYEKQVERNNQLFSMDCFNDYFSANVPYINTNVNTNLTMYNSAYVGSIKFFKIKQEDSKELLTQIYEYCVNNPIIYCINKLRFHNGSALQSKYVKMLIDKASHDIQEIDLLAQAANI